MYQFCISARVILKPSDDTEGLYGHGLPLNLALPFDCKCFVRPAPQSLASSEPILALPFPCTYPRPRIQKVCDAPLAQLYYIELPTFRMCTSIPPHRFPARLQELEHQQV